LARRLTETQHSHHDLMLSTLHVHLDHENCLEVVLLQGPTPAVRQFAEATIAETGVRHGHLHLVATDLVRSHHSHGHEHDHTDAGDDHHHPHVHLKPRT
jgi:CopG family nickel-responsive transcriptional regulator